MESLKGKNILVTGGTTGIGKATAKLLAEHGANVFIFGRNNNALVAALNEINKTTKSVIGVVADASQKSGIEKVFSEIDKRWDHLDILVNNAGVGGGSLLNSEYDDWQLILDTNLLAYIAFSRHAAERIEGGSEGHIVNIGSMSADVRDENTEAYVASKAGVQAFSDSLRKTLNKKGVKVTLIEPGSVGTDMTTENPKQKEKLQSEAKMLKPLDIANAVLFSLTQPARTEIINIKIKPLKQII